MVGYSSKDLTDNGKLKEKCETKRIIHQIAHVQSREKCLTSREVQFL